MSGLTKLAGCLGVAMVLLGPGAAAAGEYKLVIKSAVIMPEKADGSGWDAIGPPDPYVVAGIKDGKSFSAAGKTKHVSDTLRPDWNEEVLSVDIGDDIVLQVWDKDLASDDPVGEYKFTVTKKMVEDGEARVSFDQVKELRFVFKK